MSCPQLTNSNTIKYSEIKSMPRASGIYTQNYKQVMKFKNAGGYYQREEAITEAETHCPNYYINFKRLDLKPVEYNKRTKIVKGYSVYKQISLLNDTNDIVPGAIFNKALSDDLIRNIFYWSNLIRLNDIDSGIVHYQHDAYRYFVDMKNLLPDKSGDNCEPNDFLVSSETVVGFQTDDYKALFQLVASNYNNLDNVFVEFNYSDLVPNHDGYYRRDILFYLKLADIHRSPDPAFICIDLARSKMSDYGYIY